MIQEKDFKSLSEKLIAELKQDELLTVDLTAESSQFIRLNQSKVRQIGTVDDASVLITLVRKSADGYRTIKRALTITGTVEEDLRRAREALAHLRREIEGLPLDPYAQLPENKGSSSKTTRGELLSPAHAVDALLPPVQGIDFTGIYASGALIRANANSAGQFHWFYTDNYSLDYSLFTPQERALKGTLAGSEWDPGHYQEEIRRAKEQLPYLERPARKVPRGSYRTYLGPAAVADLIGMFSWRCVSESALRQGDSPLRHLRPAQTGAVAKSLSPLFTLSEDFRAGDVPRFNDQGEMAPEVLPLIAGGKLANTLVNSRTSKEYGVTANGASAFEGLRSPVVAAGSLKQGEILKRLGTGLYLSNLHYLNWSDQQNGRITGMTRYACFWVENGEIVAPIENLRWDDSIFTLFGSELEDLTETQSLIAATGSYGFRDLGATRVPGMLVKKMEFTL